jgi:hypothetical protein
LTTSSSLALISPEPVSKLLQQHAAGIAELKGQVPDLSIYDNNDVFFLRFCLTEYPNAAFADGMEWRNSPQGQRICQAAAAAIPEATTMITKDDAGKTNWNNEPILAAAPHSEIISKYITPANCITTTSSTGDLVYCIRAGAIDDNGLMDAVSIDQMVDFFLYVKEVNAIVADLRSFETDQLLSIVTCNDLSGVKLLGGSADFRKALSQSSAIASTVYPPTYAGPTLLLNLPTLLSALVKLFTPLFPDSVKQRLKFQQGPLKNVQTLVDVASSSTVPARSEFVQQLDDILYKKGS